MASSNRIAVIAWAIVPFIAMAVQAKRIPQKPVATVTAAGIIYSASGDGADQYVIANDVSSSRELWKVKVFHNHIRFWIERDVQFVFISDMKLSDKYLFVRDERDRCYSIDLTNRRVRKHGCYGIFSH